MTRLLSGVSASKRAMWSLAVAANFLLPLPNAFAQQENTVRLSASSEIGSLAGVALDQALRDGLPAEVRERGVLRIATAAFTPPIAFYSADNAAIVGIAADLAAAFGVMFGVDVEMIDLAMDSATIPAIKSGRFDMAIAGTNDTVERQQQVDFLDYMFDGKTIMVRQGNPLEISGMKDLCGKTVAVGVGTLQEKMAMSLSERCDAAMNILSIPKQPDVIVAVRSGRADATINGYATSVYTTENQIQNGLGLEAIPEVREAVGYVGMVFSKQNDAMREVSQKALQKLIGSGGYLAIMDKWGLGSLAVKEAKVNDAGSLPLDY